MSLSTFLVVKNEGQTIRRALESALPVTDEFVVGIDDSSADDTAAIVDSFAAEHPEKQFEIYRFTWTDDFSAARNAAIARCCGNWILQLDGHEYLLGDSIPVLRRYLAEAPEQVWLISVRIWLEPIEGLGNDERELIIPEVWFLQTHLWRNGKGIRYHYAAHNQITQETCPLANRLNTPDIVIVHDRPRANAAARREQRAAMNIPHFQRQVAEDPRSERGLFYLTMSYVDAAIRPGPDGEARHDRRSLRRAVRSAKKYLAAWGHTMPEQAFEMAAKLGEVCCQLEDWDGAEEAFLRCIGLQPQRAEGFYQLGLLVMRRMELLTDEYFPGGIAAADKSATEYRMKLFHLMTQAEKWLRSAVDVPPPVTSYYLRAPVYIFLPQLKLAELFANIFLYTGGVEYFTAARGYYRAVLERLPYNEEIAAQVRALEEKYREIRRAQLPAKDQPAIAIFNTTGQFSDHLATRWRNAGWLVHTWQKFDADGALWGDVLFSSWCDATAAALAAEVDRPLIVRLCRYEAYTDLPNRVDWSKVRALVVVSQSLRRQVAEHFSVECPIVVIPHGVELERLKYRRRTRGRNVAWAGYFHARKDPMLLAAIAAACPDKVFHLAGAIQQPDLWRAFRAELERRDIADRVIWHGWQPDIDQWLDAIDARYLISTSWDESFGYAIAEAMAKGIRPVIRQFPGAQELWPADHLFGDIDAAVAQLHAPVDSHFARDWVGRRYDADLEARGYAEWFNGYV